MPCVGEVSTPDEWLRYRLEKVKDDRYEDLLQYILMICKNYAIENIYFAFSGRYNNDRR